MAHKIFHLIRQFFPHSIRGRLILLLLGILLPVLFADITMAYARLQRERQQAGQVNLELARAVSATFSAYVQDVLRQEATIGLTRISAPPGSGERENALLDAIARSYPSIDDLSWVNAQGVVVQSSRPEGVGLNLADRPYFQAVAQGKDWAVSDLLVGRLTREPRVVIARGLRDQQDVLQGVAVAVMNPNHLGELANFTRVGTGAISLLDSQGRLVYHNPETPLDWSKRDEAVGLDLTQAALSGEEVTGVLPANRTFDGQPRFVALAPVPSLGWVVRASQTEEEILAPLLRDFLRSVGLLAVVGSTALLGAIVLARTVTDPITQLRAQALAIGRGRLDRRVDRDAPAELEGLAGAFNRMADQLQQRDDEREAYVHIVSHDLRNPLTSIQGYAQLIQRAADGPPQPEAIRRYAAAVASDVRRMNGMIHDLVDAARLESGQVRLQREPLQLGEFIGERLRRRAEIEGAGRIRLASVPPGLPPVLADPDRLDRVLSNLFTNALKYGDPDTEITVSLALRDDAVVTSVTDRGPGIAPDDLAHIFERYHRAETARAQSEGLGLGLYITKGLVEAHGGRIWVESRVGTGTTVSFSLPAAARLVEQHSTSDGHTPVPSA